LSRLYSICFDNCDDCDNCDCDDFDACDDCDCDDCDDCDVCDDCDCDCDDCDVCDDCDCDCDDCDDCVGDKLSSDDLCPLDDQRLDSLTNNWTQLTEMIELQYGLLAELYSAKCVTARQKEHILAAEGSSKQNDRLLNIMRRKSVADFKQFIKLLAKTGQHHLMALLDGGAGMFNVFLCVLFHSLLISISLSYSSLRPIMFECLFHGIFYMSIKTELL